MRRSMPIYEFKCEMCGHTIEALTSIRDIQAYHCPFCAEQGKDNLAFKIISKSNFKINGFNASNGYSK